VQVQVKEEVIEAARTRAPCNHIAERFCLGGGGAAGGACRVLACRHASTLVPGTHTGTFFDQGCSGKK
jgi:hypothetical protein